MGDTWRPEDAWQDLVFRHAANRSVSEESLDLLDDLRSLEELFLGNPGLEAYYRECMDLPRLEVTAARTRRKNVPPEDVGVSHAAAMQIQLMEDAFWALLLDRYANSPDNRGWMNLFRRWGHSPTFRLYFDVLATTFSREFVDFCRSYVFDWPADVPVPHPWDPEPDSDSSTGKMCYTGPMLEGAKSLKGRRASGLFLDPGRREAGESGPFEEDKDPPAHADDAADGKTPAP